MALSDAVGLRGGVGLDSYGRFEDWADFSTPGVVRIRVGKVELGQGVLTALAQIAAEELEVDLDQVEIPPLSTDVGPDHGGTTASRSISSLGARLGRACASIRQLLVGEALGRLGEAADVVTIDRGVVMAPSGAAISYWDIVAGGYPPIGSTLAVADRRPPATYRIIGTDAARVDLPAKISGAPSFVQDIAFDGMLHGRVVRPPGPAARFVGLSDGFTSDGDGAVVIDGDFLGVVAESEVAAVRAAGQLARAASWEEFDTLPDEADLVGFIQSAPAETTVVHESVDEGAAATAVQRRRMQFSKPYIAHASIGTGTAVAVWEGSQLRVWAASQHVYRLRKALADAFGIELENVVVTHVMGAGCYGHNSADDVAYDAARLAQHAHGRPVRVCWSRQDELSWSPLGSAMSAEVEAGVDPRGRVVTWRSRVWSNGYVGRPASAGPPALLGHALTAGGTPIPVSTDSGSDQAAGSVRNALPPYTIPDVRITRHLLKEMPLRTSALRSLGAFFNVFVAESCMDELAGMAGVDPLSFRLTHLDDERARAVLRDAAGRAGWPRQTPPDSSMGMGLGYARYKNSGGYCAVVAQVDAEHDLKLVRLTVAVDVGQAVNPDGVASQVEGGAVQAASWTLKEQVRFDRRRILSTDWETYPILTFSEVPPVAVHVIQRTEEPSLGAGEISLGPTAAAIGNAVADAVGVRVTDLPITRARIIEAIENE